MNVSKYVFDICLKVVSQVQHARALTKFGAGDRDAPRAPMGDRWAGGGGDRDGPRGDRPGGGGGGDRWGGGGDRGDRPPMDRGNDRWGGSGGGGGGIIFEMLLKQHYKSLFYIYKVKLIPPVGSLCLKTNRFKGLMALLLFVSVSILSYTCSGSFSVRNIRKNHHRTTTQY